ncbi:MAG: heme-binding domain-containing protein [Bacteroidetes bacterium]|nr:heme-binding domain-containing protein [Bacteroidota bacterium]
MLRKILLLLLIALIVIQFFHPKKNISTAVSQNDITLHFGVPDSVQAILKTSCYDCHSNNTRYPWYNNIQPVAWWLTNHINEGKRELNFAEFAGYAPKKQYHKLNSIVDSQRDGWMPLDSYLWIHRNAVLNPQQKQTLMTWADSLARYIKAKNNLPDEPKKND